jgi:hypothetical protein
MDRREAAHGWCSLRLRFEDRELALLKSAEQLRGVAYARSPRPGVLRTALSLAKAGRKIGRARPSTPVTLDEGEVTLLLEAVRFASQEVQWATRVQDGQDAARRDAVLAAFSELTEKGVWRTFGLTRELDAIALRLESALKS